MAHFLVSVIHLAVAVVVDAVEVVVVEEAVAVEEEVAEEAAAVVAAVVEGGKLHLYGLKKLTWRLVGNFLK